MKIDTYTQTITGIEEISGYSYCEQIQELADRSGYRNVSSGKLHKTASWNLDAETVQVRFDSRAWTGMP